MFHHCLKNVLESQCHKDYRKIKSACLQGACYCCENVCLCATYMYSEKVKVGGLLTPSRSCNNVCDRMFCCSIMHAQQQLWANLSTLGPNLGVSSWPRARRLKSGPGVSKLFF
jgi:hypothetical protein